MSSKILLLYRSSSFLPMQFKGVLLWRHFQSLQSLISFQSSPSFAIFVRFCLPLIKLILPWVHLEVPLFTNWWICVLITSSLLFGLGLSTIIYKACCVWFGVEMIRRTLSYGHVARKRIRRNALLRSFNNVGILPDWHRFHCSASYELITVGSYSASCRAGCKLSDQFMRPIFNWCLLFTLHINVENSHQVAVSGCYWLGLSGFSLRMNIPPRLWLSTLSWFLEHIAWLLFRRNQIRKNFGLRRDWPLFRVKSGLISCCLVDFRTSVSLLYVGVWS